MDEQTFDKLAGDELKKLDAALGAIAELEVDSTGDVITAEFPDGASFVINSHRAARQIWVSAEMSASHYAWDAKLSRWFDTKSGEELWDRIAAGVSRKLGREQQLRR